MKTGLVIQLIALIATFLILYFLWQWTYDAFYPPLDQIDEAFAKPWRPWARLAFTAILAVLMLGTQAYVAARRMRS
jgi:heme A synthase